jgi:REP element-mobilizing transposase RayT
MKTTAQMAEADPMTSRNKRRPRKPRRLAVVFQDYAPPVYFVTFCTARRRAILAVPGVHAAFRQYVSASERFGIGVGSYVIMPDHVHVFVRVSGGRGLGAWVKGLKRAMGMQLRDVSDDGHVWQTGFFDHMLRHNESYSQKWEYVRQNPVRKGYVSCAEDWPYSGEVVPIGDVR